MYRNTRRKGEMNEHPQSHSLVPIQCIDKSISSPTKSTKDMGLENKETWGSICLSCWKRKDTIFQQESQQGNTRFNLFLFSISKRRGFHFLRERHLNFIKYLIVISSEEVWKLLYPSQEHVIPHLHSDPVQRSL